MSVGNHIGAVITTITNNPAPTKGNKFSDINNSSSKFCSYIDPLEKSKVKPQSN